MNPMIRLELSHMKQTILVALADYNQELTKMVEAEIENAIETFDFSKAVGEIMLGVIGDAIRSYFRYGTGYDLIADATEHVLDELFERGNYGEQADWTRQTKS